MYVFAYGTLTDADRAAAILDEFEFCGDRVLDGLHRIEGIYPTLARGGKVRGRLLRTDGIDALDGYEGVDRGLYVRVPVPIADETGSQDGTAARDDGTDASTAEVYVGDPDALGAASVSWPGSGSFRDRVERYVREERVHLRRV